MITITEAASNKVKDLLEDKEAGLALRLYITGGGCSGFSYGLALDQPKETDHSYDMNGIRIVVDHDSLRFVEGAQIDYSEDSMSAGFKIHNPNAVSTCGCGSSFRTADEAGTPGSCE